MDIGRNDPCSCGSGKKYKKCCFIAHEPDIHELKKQKWAFIQKGLINKIMSHVAKVYDEAAIHLAWIEFYLFETEGGFNPESPELPIFLPWFFYEWYPDSNDDVFDNMPEMPPALSLVESRNISRDEEEYLIECCRTGFSFFEILDVVPETSMKLKDILTEELYEVLEKKGTQNVQPGDIFFGKVISIDGIDIMEACAPIVMRPENKLEILELRKYLHNENPDINQAVLHKYGIEILETYRRMYDRAMNPPTPILTNTDGHLFIPHTLIFEIEDLNATFESLHALCFNHTKEELLEMANYSKSGVLKSIEFPWLKKGNKKHRTWENTVLGHIKIEGSEMTVEVNSKERVKKFKTELKKRMPSGWKLKSTRVEPVEIDRKQKPAQKPHELKEDDLSHDPHIKAHMEKMMKAHWEDWIFQSIPALGGRRPIDAVKTKDGREALDSLLIQLERDAKARPMVGQTVETIRAVRAKLGM